jgi:2-haloacid dehalogenase
MSEPSAHAIRAIIFDLGGVLIGWDPRLLYRKLFDDDASVDRFFHEIDFYGWNLEQDRGRSFDEGIAELSARFPHYAALIRAYDERYPETLSGAIQPTVELLSKLRQAGYPLYALSNWSAEKYEYARAHFDFLNWFDTIVVSAHVKLVKPDPRIFELLLKRIGRRASECVFIDDVEKNVRAAQALSFRAIRFESAPQLATELRRLGIDIAYP